MTNVELFKAAFIHRCKEEGITDLDGIHQRVKAALAKHADGEIKEAFDVRGMIADAFRTGAGAFIGGGMGRSAGGPAGGAVGAGVGGATGYVFPELASKAMVLGVPALIGTGILAGQAAAKTQEDPIAGETIKAKELEREYRRLADKVRISTKRRQVLEGR